jgi:hypothetical protein
MKVVFVKEQRTLASLHVLLSVQNSQLSDYSLRSHSFGIGRNIYTGPYRSSQSMKDNSSAHQRRLQLDWAKISRLVSTNRTLRRVKLICCTGISMFMNIIINIPQQECYTKLMSLLRSSGDRLWGPGDEANHTKRPPSAGDLTSWRVRTPSPKLPSVIDDDKNKKPA